MPRDQHYPGQPAPSQLEEGHIDFGVPLDEFGDDEEAPPSAPYLGDPAVIEAMLRTFLKEAIDRRSAAKDGDASQADWLARRIAGDVRRLLGQSETFLPVSMAWNAPDGGIVRMVSDRYAVDGSPEEIMAVPFYRLVQAYLEAEAADARGVVDAASLIDGELGTAVATLLGVDDRPIDDETA